MTGGGVGKGRRGGEEENLRDLWENMTKSKAHAIGDPRGQGRDNGVEKNYLKKY